MVFGLQTRILFIDAYDSFSTNVIALVKNVTDDSDVDCIKHDDARLTDCDDDAFAALVRRYTAVVAGPGPGNPGEPAHVGAIARLWSLPDEHDVPILGVCLGFQSLVLHHGGSVHSLTAPKHGTVAQIQHRRADLFEGAGVVLGMQYNSLAVALGHAPHDDFWRPSRACPRLLPLAWSLLDADNGPVLMAVRHASRPHWGVQYHPESILTNAAGADVVRNWWRFALEYNRRCRMSLSAVDLYFRKQRPFLGMPPAPALANEQIASDDIPPPRSVQARQMQFCSPAAADVHAAFADGPCEPVLLASGTTAAGRPVNAETGRFSIVGLVDARRSPVLEYSAARGTVTRHTHADGVADERRVDDVWTHLKAVVAHARAADGDPDVPFWGGLVGFVSYEGCLPCTGVSAPRRADTRPDLAFVFVERSIVIDHVTREVHVQSIHPDDDAAWLDAAVGRIARLVPSPPAPQPTWTPAAVAGPARADYKARVRQCQAHIRAGAAYELCLTAATHIAFPASTAPSHRALFAALHRANPAPFAASLNLKLRTHDATLLSTSPERFVRVTRPPASTAQFRPIKGTVRKASSITAATAAAMLQSEKERAENVMIVDLTRHDLSSATGEKVTVPALCATEEYETVWQSVSVVEGRVPAQIGATGVMATCLPPGSMTGAPKRAACELLAAVEGAERGVYSGVVGYLDVGGGSDFAVVIRTAVRWRERRERDGAWNGDGGVRGGADGGVNGSSDIFNGANDMHDMHDMHGTNTNNGNTDKDDDGEEVWTIGAGGAVTALSDADAEWDEMLAKRTALLRVFEGRL